MTTQPKLLTADDLLRLHSQGVRGELIRGVLYETMPTGWRHGGSVDAKLWRFELTNASSDRGSWGTNWLAETPASGSERRP